MINIGQGRFPILTPNQANPGLNQLTQSLMRTKMMQQNRKEAMYGMPEAQQSLLAAHLTNLKNQATLPYAGPKAAADLQNQENINKYYAPNQESDIRLKLAQALMAQEGAKGKGIENQFAPQMQQAKLNEAQAHANYFNEGGPGAAGVKVQNNAISKVNALNPNLTPEQQKKAFDSYVNGEEVLPDGTLLAPIDKITKGALNMWAMKQAPASIISQQTKANQGEAELKKLTELTQKDIAPYGTTYKNMSPKQIVDSFKNDDESQERLGKFIAAQQFLYDIAQNNIRIQGGEPGFKTTEGLVKSSGQHIDAKYPMLSAKARNAAAKHQMFLASQALQARNAFGIDPSNLFSLQSKAQKAEKIENGSIPEQSQSTFKNKKVTIKNGKLVEDN